MKVKVYTTITCPWCQKTKEFLKEQSVEFTEVNVAEDEQARNEVMEKSGQMGVPVTIVNKDGDEKVIVGFDTEALKSALDLE